MVVKLNMILITSPELADFRKRLRNLESKVSINALWPNAGLLNPFSPRRTAKCYLPQSIALGVTTR